MIRQRSPSIFSQGFLLLFIGSLAFSCSFQLLLTALPLYARQMGAEDAQIGLILGLFAAASLVARPLCGWQLDRGRKVPLLALGAAIFALSAVGYAAARSVAFLLLLRAFHGLGMATYNTAGQTLVADLAPVGRLGQAMSTYAVATTLAAALAPAAGMAIALAAGFGPLFAVSFSLAAAAVVMAVALREPATRRTTTRRPRLFNRSALRPGLSMLSLMVVYGAIASFVPLYALQQGLSNPGFYFTVCSVAMVLAQAIAGPISDRFGRLAVIGPGLLLSALGAAATALLGGWSLLGAAALYGTGSGAAQPALFALATDVAKEDERGSAMATVGVFLEAGISGGAIGAGLLAQQVGLSATFVVVSVVPLVGILIAAAPRSFSVRRLGTRSAS